MSAVPEIFPLLLLSREGITENGETAIVDWLKGLQPASFTCEIERTAGSDSDQIIVAVSSGNWRRLLLPDGSRQRVYNGDAAEFTAVERAGNLMWFGARQIWWDLTGGTWNVRVWLEASPVADGRLFYQQIDDRTGQLTELM